MIKVIKKIFVIFLTMFAFCFIFLVVILTISMLPTKGKKIQKYTEPQRALLVIDIQKDFTATNAKSPFPYKDSERLIKTVNMLTKSVSHENIITIYLKQEFQGFFGKMFSSIFCKGKGIKGKPGTEIDERLFLTSDHIFSKPKGDAFSNPVFEAFLIEHQVNELYLVGLDAEYCVYHTAKGALNRGYKVSIITDAILLLKDKKWNEILKKYRERGILLVSSEEFLERKHY